jgi:hypothetical protein
MSSRFSVFFSVPRYGRDPVRHEPAAASMEDGDKDEPMPEWYGQH